MRRLTLATAVALTAAAAAAPIPVPKAKPVVKVPNYFPCELYTKWEYECGKDVTVVEVTKVRHEKNCKIATLTHTRPAKGASADIRYRVTNDAVWSIETDGNREFELVQHSVAAKPGVSWTLKRPGHFADGATITVRELTRVEVPAGKFDVIGTSLTLRGVPAEQLQLTSYFAEGVGRVMSPGERPGQPPLVLKKFSPPPK